MIPADPVVNFLRRLLWPRNPRNDTESDYWLGKAQKYSISVFSVDSVAIS